MLQSRIRLLLLVLECLCCLCVADRKASVLQNHLVQGCELLLIAGKFNFLNAEIVT